MGARGRRRDNGLAAAIAVTLAVAFTPPASGRTTGVNISGTLPASPFRITGALVYSWHGDRGRGCAAAGVCGVSGTATVGDDPAPEFMSSFDGSRELTLGSATVTVRVQRVSGTSIQTCVDSLGDALGGDNLALELSGSRSTRGIAAVAGGPSSGRCAGPLAGELAALTIPYRGSSRGGLHLELHARRRFTAGPFSGELISTLQAAPYGGIGFSQTSASQGSSGPGRPNHRQRFETIDLRYRISAAGSLVNDYAGLPNPDCQPFDACGASGSQTLTIDPASRSLELVGSLPVRARRTRAQILADLHSGRLPLDFPDPVPLATVTSERLAWPDGTTCTDSRRDEGLVALVGFTLPSGWTAYGGSVYGGSFFGAADRPRRTLPVVIGAGTQGGSPLRTHCPGPAAADLSDANGIILAGRLPLSGLGTNSLSVALANAGAFAMPGYAGRRSGAVTLRMTLVRVRTGNQVVAVG